MYDLDINFLKDRALQAEIAKGTLSKKTLGGEESKVPLYAGGAVLLALPLLALGFLFVTNQQKEEIATEIRRIDGEIEQLQAQNSQLAGLETQLTQARENRQALVSVFNQIKPISVILQDISDQAPEGIQINTIQTTPGLTTSGIPPVVIRITGIASSFNKVNDFLLTLQRSDFLDRNNTNIIATQEIANPTPIENLDGENQANLNIELPPVVQFTIESQINDIPASELLTQLDRKGARGLVTRINTLKEKGAID